MSSCLRRTVRTARTRGQGQGMLEYALIMLFVVLIVFGGLLMLGPQVSHVFSAVHSGL
jgi:Flp pilus assembly pilin Flp